MIDFISSVWASQLSWPLKLTMLLFAGLLPLWLFSFLVYFPLKFGRKYSKALASGYAALAAAFFFGYPGRTGEAAAAIALLGAVCMWAFSALSPGKDLDAVRAAENRENRTFLAGPLGRLTSLLLAGACIYAIKVIFDEDSGKLTPDFIESAALPFVIGLIAFLSFFFPAIPLYFLTVKPSDKEPRQPGQ